MRKVDGFSRAQLTAGEKDCFRQPLSNPRMKKTWPESIFWHTGTANHPSGFRRENRNLSKAWKGPKANTGRVSQDSSGFCPFVVQTLTPETA
jgi:hypothetical protein